MGRLLLRVYEGEVGIEGVRSHEVVFNEVMYGSRGVWWMIISGVWYMMAF